MLADEARQCRVGHPERGANFRQRRARLAQLAHLLDPTRDKGGLRDGCPLLLFGQSTVNVKGLSRARRKRGSA